MPKEELKVLRERMEKVIEPLKGEFLAIRTGRAHPGLVSDIKVDYYGAPTPIKQIAMNAGLEGAVILDNVKSNKSASYGFDAAKEEFCDLIKAGIVDPTKDCRSALENAASVAGMVLTTESLVADIPEPPAPIAAGGHPDMGGMY